MFEKPIRYLANTRAPSVPISATINWHHMEDWQISLQRHSRSKCRNYTDYTGNLTRIRNKMSTVPSVKSGEKIFLKSFARTSSPREAEVLGSVLLVRELGKNIWAYAWAWQLAYDFPHLKLLFQALHFSKCTSPSELIPFEFEKPLI